MNSLTQQGIAALKLGDRTAARQLLAAAIKQDPRDVTAWLWLAGAMDNEEEQIDCLRFVLKIDPHNQAATQGLAQLLERRSVPQAPPPAARPVEPEPAPPPRSTAPIPIPPADAASSRSTIESMRESVWALDEPEPEPEPFSQIEAPPAVPVDALIEDSPSPTQAAIEEALPESVQAAAEEPEPSILDSLPTPARLPFRRQAARPTEDENARLIFRSRPSIAPALMCFWLFLIGALVMAALLSDVGDIGLPLAAGVGFLLEIVVLYVIIRGLAERYELTSQQLTLRFRGKRALIPITHIYNAELTQTFFQRLLGVGNIEIDAAVNGQLSHLRLRNIPQCRLRTDQIMYLVNDHDET